jgi:tetratricopeptide (TPR) repeat protein
MRLWAIVGLALLLAGAAVAQQKTGGATSPSPPAGGNTGLGRTSPNTPSPFPDTGGPGQRPIFINGKVVLSDGTPLPERVKIERVCNGTPRVEGYSDRKGNFSFQVGQNLEMQDASSSSSQFGGGLGGLSGGRSSASPSPPGGIERSLFGCELRAALPGYRSDQISLSNIHYMDNPEIGTIILHRLGKDEGFTISVNSALAPKDARKAYEKGMEAITKKNPDEAQKNLEKAVELYPKYSAAWFALGRLDEQRDHLADADKAYRQATAAEPKLIQPYERLAWLALQDAKWQDLADWTDQLLRLNPASSAETFYLSSIAQLQLQHYDVAEKNAREAIRLDPANKNMRTYYVLGLVLAQKQNFTASAESLRHYLDSSPDPKDADLIRKQLSQVEEAAREQAQAPQK